MRYSRTDHQEIELSVVVRLLYLSEVKSKNIGANGVGLWYILLGRCSFESAHLRRE